MPMWPSGLPDYLTTRHRVIIDGETYVRLRHVHSLFNHTKRGMSFRRVKRSWLPRGKQTIGEIKFEDRPTLLLEDEFGKLNYTYDIQNENG